MFGESQRFSNRSRVHANITNTPPTNKHYVYTVRARVGMYFTKLKRVIITIILYWTRRMGGSIIAVNNAR